MKIRLAFGLLLLISVCGAGCKRDKMGASTSNYPDDVDAILRESCATSGCHNAQSAPGAAGLNLETWDALFEGSRGGSAVIPFSPDFSFLMYSVNDDVSLGPVLPPLMPYNQSPLSIQEYYTLWNWINEGGVNADGEQRFPPEANRSKYYVGHSECDEVLVFDAQSRQVMRILEVGNDPGSVEYVFDIQISPDGNDWYVIFFNTNQHIERYSTLTDEKVADIPMGDYGWSNIAFTSDSRFAFVSNDYSPQMAVVDLQRNVLVAPPILFSERSRGPTVHPTKQQVYLSSSLGSKLIALDYDSNGILSNQRDIDLVQGVPPSIAGDLWPWEIFFMPDGSKYFVSCSHTNELRVFDANTDSLQDVISLPHGPSRMVWSEAKGLLFVACMADNNSWGGDPSKLGSINVVNTSTHQLERTVYSGFQPYGLTVDDENGVLVVANRNTDPNGPTPHHASPCGDRNGYLTAIDLNSFELLNDFKPELLVDPIIVSRK